MIAIGYRDIGSNLGVFVPIKFFHMSIYTKDSSNRIQIIQGEPKPRSPIDIVLGRSMLLGSASEYIDGENGSEDNDEFFEILQYTPVHNAIMEKMYQSINKINGLNLRYSLFGPNSNTFIYTVLIDAGVPLPVLDGDNLDQAKNIRNSPGCGLYIDEKKRIWSVGSNGALEYILPISSFI